MKKTIGLLIFAGLCTMLCSCGGGSKTLNVQNPKMVADEDYYKVASEAISIVPGEYELTWQKSNEYKEFTQFNLKLKIRLDKKINFEEYEDIDTKYYSMNLDFLNNEGVNISSTGLLVCSIGKTFQDKDEDVAALRDLYHAETGTVKEINFFCMPTNDSDREAIIDNAENVQGKVSINFKMKRQ